VRSEPIRLHYAYLNPKIRYYAVTTRCVPAGPTIHERAKPQVIE